MGSSGTHSALKRSLEHFKIRFQSLAVDFDIRFALSFPSGSPEVRSLQALHFFFYKTVNIRVRNLVGIRHEGLVSTSAEPFFALQPKASRLSNIATFRYSCCRSNVGQKDSSFCNIDTLSHTNTRNNNTSSNTKPSANRDKTSRNDV